MHEVVGQGQEIQQFGDAAGAVQDLAHHHMGEEFAGRGQGHLFARQGQGLFDLALAVGGNGGLQGVGGLGHG